MKYYPIFVDIRDRKVVVVGGGEVGQRKVETLLKCGAKIALIARELTSKLKLLIDSGAIDYLGDRFEENALEGAVLVIAATNDSALNRTVSQEARARNIFVNAVDQPEDCTFIVPSIVEKGDLIIAISTSGKSPALAKRIRKELEKWLDDSYAYLVQIMGRVRKAVLAANLSQAENRQVFNSILESNILEAIGQRDWEGVKSILSSRLPSRVRTAVNVNDLLPEREEE